MHAMFVGIKSPPQRPVQLLQVRYGLRLQYWHEQTASDRKQFHIELKTENLLIVPAWCHALAQTLAKHLHPELGRSEWQQLVYCPITSVNHIPMQQVLHEQHLLSE